MLNMKDKNSFHVCVIPVAEPTSSGRRSKSSKETARSNGAEGAEGEGTIELGSCVLSGQPDDQMEVSEAGFVGKRKRSPGEEELSEKMETESDAEPKNITGTELEKQQKGKPPQKWRKTSTMQVGRDVETETKMEDGMETTTTKAMKVTVMEDTLTPEQEAEKSEVITMLAPSESWDLLSYPPVGDKEGKLRVLASCAIHRQANVAKTIITGEMKI